MAVVDIEGFNGSSLDSDCKIYFSHWDDQFIASCNKFASWAEGTSKGAAGLAIGNFCKG